MAVPCKLRSSKHGKGTAQTSVLLKRHSIIVHGATAKRDSANTPKRWKLRRPHNVWRGNHAPMFVRRSSSDAIRERNVLSPTSYAERLSREARGKYKRTCGEGVRRTGWTGWFVVEPRPHVFTRREESLDRRARRRMLLREAAERRRSRTSPSRLHRCASTRAVRRHARSAPGVWSCRKHDVETDRSRKYACSTLVQCRRVHRRRIREDRASR